MLTVNDYVIKYTIILYSHKENKLNREKNFNESDSFLINQNFFHFIHSNLL